MPDWLSAIFASDRYMPHGHCYLWEPAIVWTHVVSDWLIGVAYVGISITLYALVKKIQLPFTTMFLAFGLFIGACGLTHFMEIWTMWQPYYWLEGGVKVVTAAASVATALFLLPLRPKVVALARSARLAEERREQLEQKNAELEQLYRRLKETDELRRRFFANVSHELRTPLALLIGPVERMLAGGVTDEQREDLQLVRRNAHLLLKQINDLLEVARLEAGQQSIRYESFDLAAFVRLTASHFEGVARTRQVELDLQVPSSLTVEADPQKIERVVVNLLSNAFKFTPEMGRVRVVLESTDTEARLVVSDTGPGVPVDQREAIFERFRQLDGSSARRFGGTGLGLAIARDFAQLHRGTLRADAAPEGGARFTFALPRHAAEGVAVAPPSAAELAAAVTADLEQLQPELESEGVESATADASVPTVLVVEDNMDLRRLLRSLLSAEFQVVTAKDGSEGHEKARALQPDLVITDVMMPEVTGEELLHRLRADETTRDIPVIVLTARLDHELRMKLLEGGAQDFLTKPFSADEVLARVRNLVAMHRARGVLQQELATREGDLEQLARELTSRTRELQVAVESARVARENAERSSRVKTTFLGMVSHELRTPLTSMQLSLDSLLRLSDPPLMARHRKTIERIGRSAERLSEIVESILTYTQLESGRLLVQAERFDLPALVEELVEETRPQAQMKLLDLRLHAGRDLPPLESDPRLVRLVVLNLVANAIKYTEKGHVEVRAVFDGEQHTIAVSDTGPGIPQEAQDRIFQPFEQLEPLARKHTPGVGLGLALVREMVQSLGGTVTLDSEVGKGSTFSVRLPSTMKAIGADSFPARSK